MRRALLPAAALALGALSTACAPEAGIWLFELAAAPLDDLTCSVSPSHNFDGASVTAQAVEESPWTQETAETWSASAFFGLISETGDGAVMVVGEETWPGAEVEGLWTFSWTRETIAEESAIHESGYGYSYTAEQRAGMTVQGRFDGGAFSGTWESSDETWQQWTESDTWAQEVADEIGGAGAIPAGDYLSTEDAETGEPVAASNTWDVYDCADTCTLTVSSWCGYTFSLAGSRTDLDPADFDAVRGAGQDAGY